MENWSILEKIEKQTRQQALFTKMYEQQAQQAASK